MNWNSGRFIFAGCLIFPLNFAQREIGFIPVKIRIKLRQFIHVRHIVTEHGPKRKRPKRKGGVSFLPAPPGVGRSNLGWIEGRRGGRLRDADDYVIET